MKNCFLLIILLSFSSLITGQVYEVGVTLGGANYIGDVGSTTYINPNEVAGNVFFKYNYNPRIALKATYSYLPISGNDLDADTDFRQNRNFNFDNVINELAVGLEFNFYEYDVYSDDKSWTPYITIEFAAFNYRTVQSEVQPGEFIYTNNTAFTAPIGVGFKSRLFGKFAFSLESKIRYAFQDDLDYSTDQIPAVNVEGTSNDWFVFTGFSLIYTFGRPACYTNGL
ncbi:DUF6089 family protein [uncultured Polaribacter sp.]|uniref:type IX secretion system protein PorG n=1 Tax=uncultured Polaribacter sp. TaxID=174711 RepID=UPI002619ED21|nr:DUF6089 family protein [uncultured Polaribacter sp.]